MNSGPGARPVKVVLGEALDEIRERAERLQQFGDELADARRFIAAIEKTIGAKQHPKPTAVNPVGDSKRQVLEAVDGSMERLSLEQIAEKIGRKPAGWLAMLCKRLVDAGELDCVDGKYGKASALRKDDAA